MKSVSPVAHDPETRWGVSEVTYAKDQSEYLALPALRFSDGLVVTRWRFSLIERLQILFGGSVYVGVLTFNKPLQPIKISTSVQDVVGLEQEDQ